MNRPWFKKIGGAVLTSVLLIGSPGYAALVQHLDARVATSVTTNGSGEVSAWADLSGNGNDATSNVGSVFYPSTSLSFSDLAGLDVGTNNNNLALFTATESDAWLDFSGAASNNSGFAVLLVFKLDGTINSHQDIFGNDSTTDGGGFFIRRRTGEDILVSLGDQDWDSSGSVAVGDTVIIGLNYNASSGNVEFYNSPDGFTVTHNVTATNFSKSRSVTVGSTSAAGRYLNGMVGEIKIYNGGLDAAAFQSEIVLLEAKWNAIATIKTPRGLTAAVDDEWVELDWDDDESGDLFASFTVYRSSESGINYVEIKSGLTASEYIDVGIPGGVTYYYVVTAVDTNGVESLYSNEIAAVPNEVVRLQHLDATVAGSVLTYGGMVTQWVDQTTSGNDALPMVGNVLYPSTSLSESGLAGLDMQAGRNSLELFSSAGSNSWLDQSGSTNGFCVMVALKCDAVMTGGNNDVIGNSVDGSSGFGMRYTGAGEIEAWLGGQVITSAGPDIVKDGDTLIFALDYDAETGAYDFWDSKNYTSTTGSLAKADFSTASPVTLGSAASSSRYLNGMVGEVKIFGSGLSPANFERERVKLLNKWTAKPNIVLIFVDDWAWNGSPIRMDDRMQNSTIDLVEMPRFETLAAQGMRFRNAYGSAMCVPSRACLQTGMSSARHQFTVELSVTDYYDTRSIYDGFPVIGNGIRKPLPSLITTIPEALRPLGYKCAHYGKWHLSSDPAVEGYEESDGDTNNEPGSQDTTISGLYDIPADFTNPKRMVELTDRTIAFMQKKVVEDSPFYVQTSHYAMHEGRECTKSSRARYQNLPRVVELNGGETDPSKIKKRNDPAVWLGMAYDLDTQIGRVLDELDALGIADNTYVIIMSDNGYRHNIIEEQPLHARKWWVWQGGIRVPMIVRGPGIEAGSLCTANVVNYDLLPTYVDWAGGDPTRLKDIDGISLESLMAGETPTESFLNRSLYFHYPHYRTTMPHSSIVKGNYKVVHFYETPVRFPAWNPVMLFDLASDPGEYRNIAPEKPAVAEVLFSDLTNHLAVAGGRVPTNNAANYNSTAYEAAAEYDTRVVNGPFIGSRSPEADESAQIQSYVDYWMDSWGMPIGTQTNDYDGDGIANLTEYALGGDPTDELDIGMRPKIEQVGGDFNYVYAKRRDDSDLVYSVDTTTNLVSGVWTQVGLGTETNVHDAVFNRINHSISTDNPQSYIRLKITNP